MGSKKNGFALNKDTSSNKLQFQFANSNNAPKEGAMSTFGPDQHSYSLDQYFRYFMQYKKLIIAIAIIVPVLAFTMYQNKDFNAQVAFKVEPEQDLTSNILSDSLLGVGKQKTALSGLIDRLVISAQSKTFFDQMAKEVIENDKYAFTKYKLGLERKPWLEFIKRTIFNLDIQNEEDYIYSRISEHLENVLEASKSGEQSIYFNVSTKSKELTKNIQMLVKEHAGKLLIEEPLNESENALKILEETEANIFQELDSLGEQILGLQKKHNTLMPTELPARYANIRLEIEKSLLDNLVKTKTAQSKLRKLKAGLKGGLANFEANKEIETIQKEITALKGAKSSLNTKLDGMAKDFGDLPKFSSEMERIELRKKILLGKLHKLTEQLSLAKITHEKVKSSLDYLDINEKIKTVGQIKILVKTMVTTFTLLLVGLFGIYYKQSLFPKLMRPEDLDGLPVPIGATIPFGKISSEDNATDYHTNPRSLAMQSFYHKQIKGHRWFTIAPVSKAGKWQKDIYDLIGFMLNRGQKVTVLDMGQKGAEKLEEFENLHEGKFSFYQSGNDNSKTDFVNKREIRRFLNSRDKKELIFILSQDLESSPNGLFLSMLTDKTFAMASLFKTSNNSIQKFFKQRDRVPASLGQKFSFVLGNAMPYDDIKTFIASGDVNQGENDEDAKNHLKIA